MAGSGSGFDPNEKTIGLMSLGGQQHVSHGRKLLRKGFCKVFYRFLVITHSYRGIGVCIRSFDDWLT